MIFNSKINLRRLIAFECNNKRMLSWRLVLLFFIFTLANTILNCGKIDSLETAVLRANDRYKPEIYNSLSKSYQNTSSSKSIEYSKLALEYSQKNGDKKNEALAYFNLGFNYVTLNNIAEAINCFQKALNIRLEIGDKLLIASSYNSMGNVTKLTGNNQLALEYYLKSLEIRKEIGDKLLIASTINNIGIVYKFWGNYEKALEYYLQSLHYAESLKDTTLLIPAFLNIGNVYSELKNYSEALEYYFRVLEISKKVNNLSEVASAYNSIGTAFNFMNNISKAIEYFNCSYKLAKQIGNNITQCNSLNNLGESYHRLNDYEKALKYYQLSAELSSSSNDIVSNATSLNNIGAIYRSKKEYKKALPFLLKSLELNVKHENLIILKDNYINLAFVYNGLKDFKKAFHYYCLFSDLNDSLSSESLKKKIVDLQIKFETEKKEKEIELLRNEQKIESGTKKYLYALLCLGTLLIFVVLILFVIKLRANKTLASKNEQISSQKSQLERTLEDLNKINEENEKYLNIMSDELTRASDYVISLIPSEIRNGNIRTQWILKPSSKLGGDTFGYHWLDPENLAIYLLDVSGHGVGASLHSISILNTIKYQTLHNIDFTNPVEVLSSLNNVFQMREHNKLFFTIWYGVYNNNTRELVYSSAGHPPAILLDNSGSSSLLGSKNLIIGAIKNTDYLSNSTIVNPDSKLFVFSDGVYEIWDKSGNIWSIEDLKDFIEEKSSVSDNEINDLYHFAINYHENDTLDDDFSVLKVTFD